ncbi:MAG: HAMP domain-containing protein [Nitrospirae bacterium]|nr:HAMP domain-containing protein [Nitrospirota bacterium]
MKLKLNLQSRFILMIALVLFIALSISTVVLIFVTADKYRNVIYSKTAAMGEVILHDIGKALNLGIPVEYIEGVNEKLQALMSKDKDIAYSMVTDTKGKVLFHSDTSLVGKELTDKPSLNAASTDKLLVQRHDFFYDLSLPLNNAEGKQVAFLRIGLRYSAVNAQVYSLIIGALGMSLSSFLVSLIFIYFYISKFITGPLIRMEHAAEQIAAGNLAVKVDVRGEDEISSLGRAINRIASNLKDILTKIRSITNSVQSVTENIVLSSGKVLSGANFQHNAVEKTAGFVREIDNSISSVAESAKNLSLSSEGTSASSLEMATSIENVAENANFFSASASSAASSVEEMIASIKEIADSLELLSASFDETSSSLTEISTTVREIEDNAVESVRLAEHVTVEASDKGMNAADAAIKGIEEIKASVGSLADAINRLGKRSEEIGEILTVIAEVADQTSLLALNAAILAAQAGEHGKGFAVVADEIKDLAGKTAISTKEIASLIESVQTETRSSVKMVKEGMLSVDKGVKLVQEVNVTLRSIVESAGTSTEKAKFIQRATTEETQVIEHVTKAIKHMSEQIAHISRATKEQDKGGRLVIDAVEKIKEISRQVKNATAEQSEASKHISKASGNVSQQAEQIADATAKQQEKSKEIVSSIESIKKIAAESVNISNQMNAAVRSMEEEAKSLLLELQKFKV